MGKLLFLSSNEASQENIAKIIEYIREFEKSNGLSDEEISYKYTHGECSSLAGVIKRILPKAHPVIFGSGEYAHYCIEVPLTPKDKDYDEETCYFDINGKKYLSEMQEFLIEELNAPNKSALSPSRVGVTQVVRDTDATTTLTRFAVVGTEKEPDKKVLTKGKIKEILSCEDVSRIRSQLVLAGVPMAKSEGLDVRELKSMLFDKITYDSESVINILTRGTVNLKQVLMGMGFDIKELSNMSREDLERTFISKVGIDAVSRASVETTKTPENAQEHSYYHTLMSMRQARGQLLTDTLKRIPSREEQEKLLESFSVEQVEDVEHCLGKKSEKSLDEVVFSM